MELLNKSPYSHVYRFGKQVIKKFPPAQYGYCDVALNEYKIFNLVHPHVPISIEYEEIEGGGGSTLIKMPYLGKAIKYVPLEYSSAHNLITNLLRQLASLHHHKFVHGDLKTENVLIGEDTNPYLIDFGLTLASGTITRQLTYGLYYRPPELVQITLNKSDVVGLYQVKPYTDIWALGILWYQLVTGDYLFFSQNVKEVERMQRNFNPDEFLGKPFKEKDGLLIRRMLSINPDERPTAIECLTFLEGASSIPTLPTPEKIGQIIGIDESWPSDLIYKPNYLIWLEGMAKVNMLLALRLLFWAQLIAQTHRLDDPRRVVVWLIKILDPTMYSDRIFTLREFDMMSNQTAIENFLLSSLGIHWTLPDHGLNIDSTRWFLDWLEGKKIITFEQLKNLTFEQLMLH